MKPYKLGLIVGRFQIFHLGHVNMISTALQLCERVILFVGSSQESRTSKNPFTFEERKEMISDVLKTDKLVILPLPDAGIGNNKKWGDYIFLNIPNEYGVPDIAISGRESRRTSWFDNYNISELFVAKSIPISATKMRGFLEQGEEESWKTFCPAELHNKYEQLRKIVLETQSNNYTESI